MKRKTLTLGLGLLAILSLVGIGFATWQITKPATAEPLNGTIEAYEAVEVGASVEMEWKDLDGITTDVDNQLIFGLPSTYVAGATDNRTYKWFSFTEPEKMEKDQLQLTLNIAITDADELLEDTSIYVYLVPSNETIFNEVFNNEIAKKINGLDLNYDSNPNDANKKNDAILLEEFTKTELVALLNAEKVKNENADTITVTVNIASGWGSVFGNDNPYVTFGKEEYSAANSNHTNLVENLNKLSENMEKLGFSLYIKNDNSSSGSN